MSRNNSISITRANTAHIPDSFAQRASDDDVVVEIRSNAEDSKYIYIDCIFSNTSDTKGYPVDFSQTRTKNIVDNMSEYKMAVASVNGKFYTVLFNMADKEQYIKLEYPPDNLSTIVYLPSTPIEIYTAEQYLSYVNSALETGWTNIKSDYDVIYGTGSWVGNSALPQVAPGVVYDANNQLFTMYADYRCEESNINKVLIYFNLNVYSKFIGLTFENRFVENRLIFLSGYQNTNYVTIGSNQLVKNVQDSPSMGFWSDTASILITSNALNGRKEEFAIATQDSSQSSSALNSVIASFPINKTGILNRYIEYANPNYQWVDLYSDGGLQWLQFRLSYLTFNGDIYPVSIGPRSSIIVKLIFAKTLYTA